MISPQLSWTDHVKKIVSSAKFKLFNLFRFLKSRDPTFLAKMFVTYVRPCLEFATPAFNSLNKKLIASIENVQRTATRWIFIRAPKLSPQTSYHERLTYLNLESLETRRNNYDASVFQHILHKKVDCNIPIIRYQTKTRGPKTKIRVPKCKTTIRQNSFTIRANILYHKIIGQRIRNWNVFPLFVTI